MHGTIKIDLDALRDNATRLRDFVAPATAAFVVKGNAYGHGIEEVALALEPIAARLCVFNVAEAQQLRDAGITKEILILGPVAPDDLESVLVAKASMALWDSGAYAARVADVARRRSSQMHVHVKINSGLNRLGIAAQNAADIIEDYLRRPELRIDGAFSHLAAAEELDSPYTLAQLQTFESALAPVMAQLQDRTPRPIMHIAASAAALLWPQTRLDMVRFGIAVYGLWPSAATREAMHESDLHLEPALSYTSNLDATRMLVAGDAVGYGNTFHAPRAMRIGVVPQGYADGIPRALSNRGTFLVRGARAPIIGRIAMNMTLIDLTNAPDAKSGDEVTLIGNDGTQSITADDWAGWSDTINYEIVTRLPETAGREFTEAIPAQID